MAAKKLLQTASAQAERLAANLALGILVDPEDIELLERYSWHVDKGGYAKSWVDGKATHLHRLVHSRWTGKPLSEYTCKDHVRHIDPNGRDCRRSNLFEKTGGTANNCDVNVAKNTRNTSGTNGVSWYEPTKQWRVNLAYQHRNIHLGFYDTREEAALVANHCRDLRSQITCSDATMDYETMKALLKAEAKKIATNQRKEAA